MQIGNITIKPGQLYIGMAVLMALMCGLIMKGGLSSKPDSKEKTSLEKAHAPEPTTPVVVAAYPVHAGEVLQPDQLQVVDWPVKLLPVGHTFEDLSTLVGKVARADVFQGEPVFREKLASNDATGGLPVLIPKGLRAVTVAVSEVKGVAGFIKPGDKVDVLATFDLQENNKKDQITRTVLQNVLVIATAQEMVKNNLPKPEDVPEVEARKKQAETAKKKADATGETTDKAEKPEDAKNEKADKKTEEDEEKKKAEENAKLVPSITLALTAAQAEKLTLAEDTGSIRLILRADNDTDIKPTSGIRQSQLIGKPVETASKSAPVINLPSRPRFSIEVIEGTDKRAQNF